MTDALAEQDSRKRDPVKRAIFVGALLAALMLVWFSSILLGHMVANNNLAQVQSEIQAHTNDYNIAISSLKNFHAEQDRLADAGSCEQTDALAAADREQSIDRTDPHVQRLAYRAAHQRIHGLGCGRQAFAAT